MVEAPAQASGLQPRWARLQIMGLLMVAAGPIVFLIASMAFGQDLSEDVGFIAVILAVPLIAAWLVSRYGTWAKVVGAVVGLAAALMLFWAAFGLATPQSFFEFMFGVLVTPGALIALISGVAAVVASRRGHVSAKATGGEASAMRAIRLAIVGLAVMSAIVTAVGHSTASSAGASATIRMKNSKFEPKAYDVAPGSTVFVKNDDPIIHTFTIKALDIDRKVNPRSSVLITIPSRPGNFVLYCKLHSGDPPDLSDQNDMAAAFEIR